MSKRGRQTSFKPEYVECVEKLCRLGATDAEIASFLDTSEQTVIAWKKAHPEFLEALMAGKAASDMEVTESLYRRAVGAKLSIRR